MSVRGDRLVWFGLFGAPVAFVCQFVAGFWIAETACSTAAGASVSVNAITTVTTAVAATVAVLALLSAIWVWRDTRGAAGAGGSDEPPPLGRVHFLATVAITIVPLFLAIILMSGLGAIFLPECVQS